MPHDRFQSLSCNAHIFEHFLDIALQNQKRIGHFKQAVAVCQARANCHKSMGCVDRYHQIVLSHAAEDVQAGSGILLNKARNFPTGIIDTGQSRNERDLHAAIRQVTGAHHYAPMVADQEDGLSAHILSVTGQQIGQRLVLTRGRALLWRQDRAPQSQAAFHRIQEIAQRNGFIKDRHCSGSQHFIARHTVGHASDDNGLEGLVFRADTPHQFHPRYAW
ncbi:MAG: hypothetical protein ACUVRJ_00555 [Candidatus Villigracilaceae bacterium]